MQAIHLDHSGWKSYLNQDPTDQRCGRQPKTGKAPAAPLLI
jgi:hypothetical protein